MKDFIINIIEILKQNSSQLPEIRTYKKGVLPPLPAFGAISAIPRSTTFNFKYTNGIYHEANEISLQIYLKGYKIDLIRKALRNLYDKVSDILTKNYTLNGITYDLYISNFSMEDPLDLIDGIVQGISMNIIGYSEQTRTIENNNFDLKFGNENEIIDFLKNLIINNVNNPSFSNLSKIKKLDTHSIKTKVYFPVVLIDGSLDSTKIREYAGLDINEYNGTISIFTKLLDKNYSLYYNLDITSDLFKLIVEKTGNMNGYLLDHEVSSIEYYQILEANLGLVYHTSLNFNGVSLAKSFNSI